MIDFHSHLDLYGHPAEVIQECIKQEITVLSVTNTPTAFGGTSRLALGFPNIHTALGLHPQLAHERKSELELFDSLLEEVKFVGEIGLDGSPEHKLHWQSQTEVFSHILSSCQRLGGRILSVHSRRATSEVLNILEKYPRSGTPILHWYSGNFKDLTRAIDLGCWFSIGPPMLAGEKGRSLISRIPRDRILTETDGPFVQIAGRGAFPWDVRIAESSLCSVWKQSVESTQSTLSDNLTRLCAAIQ